MINKDFYLAPWWLKNQPHKKYICGHEKVKSRDSNMYCPKCSKDYKDFYLAPWWIRKHSHRLRVQIGSWVLIGALIGLSMLLAWVMIGCDTVRHCNSYQAGIDRGIWWDACFSPSQAVDEEEYGQIINSMTWER